MQSELGVKTEEEARRLAARKNALNRFGKPEELASAIVFLCSERASYITGVSLNLDGGTPQGAVVDLQPIPGAGAQQALREALAGTRS